MNEENKIRGYEDSYTLPPFFEDKREELYYFNSQLIQAIWKGDIKARDTLIPEYLSRMDYIVTRIMPRLHEKDEQFAKDIKTFAKTFYQVFRDAPEQGIPYLENCHSKLCELLTAYDFDTIIKKSLVIR